MKKVGTTNDRKLCAALFALGTALLVYGSLVPFHFRAVPLSAGFEYFKSLFRLPGQYWGETADWSLNLTIMIPIAFCAMGALVDGRDRWLAWLAAPFAVLVCLPISLAVEFAQIWSVGRVASARDVVAQALGACVGVVCWLVLGDRFSAWRRSFAERRESQHRLEWILQAYLLGLAIYSLVPVNLVMSPGELAQKYRHGLIELVPFAASHGGLLNSLYSALADVLLFVPVGMCAAGAWNRRGRLLRPIPKALTIGMLYTLGLEAAQLFIVGRYSSSTDVILGFAGVTLGVILMHCWRRDASVTSATTGSEVQAGILWLLAAIAYAAFLAAIFWAPFRISNDGELVKNRLDAFIAIPFSRMHEGSDLLGIFAAARKVLWFVPLGVILGMAATRLSAHVNRGLSIVAAALAILAVAFAIELGQVLLPDKVADSTDVLLSFIGGLMGLFAAVLVFSNDGTEAAAFQSSEARRGAVSNRHLRGLDGLRALACLAVFGVHFQQATGVTGRWGFVDIGQLLENGNTGVALFFVLSGFLLALPLWNRASVNPLADVLHGYAGKRLARILPAYYLCLTALVLIKRHWQGSSGLQSTVLHYLCLQNYSPTAFYSISSQFWTVAVQMQFYLVFALIVWGMARARITSERTTMVLFALICLGSYLLHVAVMNSASPEQIAEWGPVLSRSVLAHFPLFLIGAMTSFVFVKRRIKPAESAARASLVRDVAFALSALAMLMILGTPLDNWFQIPYGRYNLPFVPLLLALILFVTPDSRAAAKLLEFAPFRLLGVISYGFFIYHLAIMGLVSRALAVVERSPQSDPLVFAGVSILLTIAVASASYVFFERPLYAWMTKRRKTPTSPTLRQAAGEFR